MSFHFDQHTFPLKSSKQWLKDQIQEDCSVIPLKYCRGKHLVLLWLCSKQKSSISHTIMMNRNSLGHTHDTHHKKREMIQNEFFLKIVRNNQKTVAKSHILTNKHGCGSKSLDPFLL